MRAKQKEITLYLLANVLEAVLEFMLSVLKAGFLKSYKLEKVTKS